jgi:DNA primase
VARIKDSSVDAVKAAADMVAVVEGRTTLRKSGSRFTGRCPFHEERTPSFSVNAVDKLYYCFGCGAKGDLITFVRETEGLDFAGAIEWLAGRFNVPIEYEESSPQVEEARRRRDRLLALLEQATAFYERYLWETAVGEPVRAYLESRGLHAAAAREFRLGLSPAGSMLSRKARERGFGDAELRTTGLLGPRGKDYFARRLMFPLADGRGRVVGFQARKLHEDDPLKGKYVNSPEGELFHKSAMLYGLHLARPAIAKEDRAVVVEGNTDVIALHQAGIRAAVASMGTALTEAQLKELGRLTRRLFLCFDADAAGEEATLRGMQLAAARGFDVWIVTSLPPGVDPADAPDDFERHLATAEKYARYRVAVEVERALPDRQAAYRRVKEILDPLPDGPDKLDAWQLANDRLGLTVQLQSGGAAAAATAAPVSGKVLAAGERLEREALAGCIAHPGLLRLLSELGPDHFELEQHRRLRAALLGEEAEDEELVGLRAELDAQAAAGGIDEGTTEQLLLRLRERRLQRELADADVDRLLDLQQALARVRTAIREFA